MFNNNVDGLISSDSRAFNIDGTGLTLNNAGTIIGTGVQRNGTLYSDGTATDFTVINSGTIDAGVEGSGFAAEIGPDGNAFTFDNSGTIQGRGTVDAADEIRAISSCLCSVARESLQRNEALPADNGYRYCLRATDVRPSPIDLMTFEVVSEAMPNKRA